MTKRLVIIDGKSVFYRGYYAMPGLSTKDGTPTGGVYGFAVMALEIVKKLQPDYVCVAWDKSGTNVRSRRELYPQYKANRKPPPADFYEQIPILHQLLESLGWPLYEMDDYEADDIMGAFADQATKQDIESYLVTSDLDVLQLVSSHTYIYTLKKGLSNIELFSMAAFREKYGVDPHQFIDVKALKGDASDNVPGVAGIGEKGALELISKYESLDGVYEHLDELKPGLRAKLEKDKDMAYLSKKLVTIMVDAPITLDLKHAALQHEIRPEFIAMLRKLEFRTLLRQAEAQRAAEEQTAIGGEVSAEEAGPSAKEISFSTDACKPETDRVIAMDPSGATLWVSLEAATYMQIPVGELSEKTVTTLANGPVIGHDLKSVFRVLLANGLTWPGIVGHDTRIGAFLLNSLIRAHELGDIVGRTLDPADGAAIMPAIWQAYDLQYKELQSIPKLAELAKTVEFPMISLLAVIEHRGILLDSSYLQTMSGEFAEKISGLEQQIYKEAGQEFNISSPSQLGMILFEKLGLPTAGVKKGKTGYSTGANELAKLRMLHPIIDHVTEYREYTKLKSTYIDALPKLVDREGKLHTTFALDVAATGRLSSHDPNLQNIPTRTDIGLAIRKAFVPHEGNVFVSADYNQFELRLSAVMAQDKELIDDFNHDVDVHTKTAAQIYGVPMDKVDKTMRRHAKVVNFGILYGMSPHGLSIATGMTFIEARDFIQKYFELRKPIREYIDGIVEKALKDGYVETLLGRRRPTPDLKSSNFAVREAAKRAAMNMPIQGTEADIMKIAMLAVENKLEGVGEQLLQVHDSILVETPADKAEEVAKILKETMENAYTLPVTLRVDVTTGENWGML